MIKRIYKVERVYSDSFKWLIKETETVKIYVFGILIFNKVEDCINNNDDSIYKSGKTTVGFTK